MAINFQKIIVKFILAGALLFSLPLGASALGILAEPINIDNARRGQSVWSELLFINSESKPVTFNLSAEGIISKWVSFYSLSDNSRPITQLVVPANSNLGAKVKFVIPENAANGKYQGMVVGMATAANMEMSSEASVQVNQRFDREVNITVTDNQILEFKTIFTPASYVMANGDPFKVKVIHDNAGNVDIKPTVELRVTKDGQEIFKSIFPYPDNLGAIQPNERKEILDQVIWRTKGYEEGKYSVALSTMIDNKVNQKEEFFITLGAGNNPAAAANIYQIFKNSGLTFAVVAAIGILAVGLVTFLKVRQRVFVKK